MAFCARQSQKFQGKKSPARWRERENACRGAPLFLQPAVAAGFHARDEALGDLALLPGRRTVILAGTGWAPDHPGRDLPPDRLGVALAELLVAHPLLPGRSLFPPLIARAAGERPKEQKGAGPPPHGLLHPPLLPLPIRLPQLLQQALPLLGRGQEGPLAREDHLAGPPPPGAAKPLDRKAVHPHPAVVPPPAVEGGEGRGLAEGLLPGLPRRA